MRKIPTEDAAHFTGNIWPKCVEFGIIWGRASGDDVYTRDYTSIGAACGIAAAFRAPIAPWMRVACHAPRMPCGNSTIRSMVPR